MVEHLNNAIHWHAIHAWWRKTSILDMAPKRPDTMTDTVFDKQTCSCQDLSLGLETSRDSFLQVLVSVLVLEPQSLGLGLGLRSLESRSRSWSWDLGQWRVQELHPLLKVFCLPVISAPVEQIFSHSGLLMRANMARMDDNMLLQLVYLRCNNKL